MDNYLRVRLGREPNDESVYLEALSKDNKYWYLLPAKSPLNEHAELQTKNAVARAAAAIKRVRHVQVKWTDALKQSYLDEDENFTFDNELLVEETEESGNVLDYSVIANKSEEEVYLLKRIAELEKQNANLAQEREQARFRDVEKLLTIEKFNGRQSTTDWIERFERECARNKINSAGQMIEAMKFFMKDSALDWYHAKYKQLGLSNWSSWKSSLLEIFADKGWAAVNRAYDFKYIGGLFLEFALRKDNLLLEAEPEMTEKSRIGAIVYCLPKAVQKELDREKIKTVDLLCVELRRLDDPNLNKKQSTKGDDGYKNQQQQNNKQQSDNGRTGGHNSKQRSESSRDPCFMCTFIGLTNPPRYHSPVKCENKQKYAAKLQSVNCVIEKEEHESSGSDEIARIMNIQLEQPKN